MEVLNKRYFYFIVVSFLFVQTLTAQVKTAVDLFAESYKYEEQNKLADAIDVLLKVPADTYAKNIRLGWLYYRNGQYKLSTSYYAKAIQLRPQSVEARFGYVLPAAKLKEWDKVSQQYDAILSVDPNNTKALYYRGLIYYNQGKYDKASEYLEKIERLYPFDYDSVILYAWNSYYLGDKSKAKSLFDQALFIRPSSASAKEGLSLLSK